MDVGCNQEAADEDERLDEATMALKRVDHQYIRERMVQFNILHSFSLVTYQNQLKEQRFLLQ